MNERLPLSEFPNLCGPMSHFALHVSLREDSRYTLVRERLFPDSGVLLIVLHGAVDGRDYRLIYHPADVNQRTWRLIAASPWNVEAPEAAPAALA